ncbi:MAG: hypothetical protein KME08_18625 [Aphanothece sp. CMT-3BRIN-NPC111]|jgi:hypothetical protein|nr:hypothetical protein [Aphanothece sp. CMT-3BRIN-NPC111]
MNQEIIQKFLTLPGVLGVALVHGQASPYLYIKEQTLDWQQKQTISSHILQFIAKATEEVEFSEFQVMGYYAYIYKLASNLKFIVLNHTDSVAIKFLAAKQLKAALQEDIEKTITTFELLTKNISPPRAVSTAEARQASTSGYRSGNTTLEVKVTIGELVNALNHLSKFSSNYMGTKLVVNYWQLSRPKFEWLDNFTINRSGELAFNGGMTEFVTGLQHQWVKNWTAAFIRQCSKIMQDLPSMIEEKGLDEEKKRLLLSSNARQ